MLPCSCRNKCNKNYCPYRATISEHIFQGLGPHLVLGCFISTWDHGYGLATRSRGRAPLLYDHTRPRDASDGTSRSDCSALRAARCGVLPGEFRADSGLRVPLRVPPCGATRPQRAPTFEEYHLAPLVSSWLSRPGPGSEAQNLTPGVMVTIWHPAPEGAQLWFMDSSGPGMQMIRSHGRIERQAARCVVIRGEFRAYSGLTAAGCP